jgi:phosphoglycerol transferase
VVVKKSRGRAAAERPVFDGRAIWLEVALYAGVAVATLLAAWTALGLRTSELRVPLTYHGDAVWSLTSVKTMIETGWVLQNPLLGFPGVQSTTPFPITEMLQLLILRCIAAFSRDAGVVVNLYYLLGYVLVAIAALAAFRAFRVSSAPAAVGSVLYALLPFHFLRGELHLGLSSYYLVPLGVMVALWAWSSRPPVFACAGEDGRWSLTLNDRRTIVALVVCLLTGLQGVYYAAFAAFFILGAGAIGALSSKQWKRLVGPTALVCIIAIGVSLAMVPYITASDGGLRPGVVGRSPADTVVLGLKLSDLLLPAPGHRIQALAELQTRMAAELASQSWVLNNESHTSSLGLIGSCGLLFLLGWLPYEALRGGRVRLTAHRLFTRLSTFTLMGLLLSMNGGFGTLISLMGLTQLRAYNRISVFIAFFALFAVVLLLDAWFDAPRRGALWTWGLVAAVVLLGVLDQAPGTPSPIQAMAMPRSEIVARYDSDVVFVRGVEAAVPPGSAVFQLPYIGFPESGSTNWMSDYEHFRGYLHSKTLRWSYGAFRGTDAARFSEQTAKLPAKEMVTELKDSGFSGVWLDVRGYPAGEADKVVVDLESTLGPATIVDAARTRVFWRLP